MNPTDLRTELSARAAESEGHEYGDLLPGVQRKIRRTKQRRVGTALAGTAAVAAIAVGVLPNLDTTSTPDPAGTQTPPQDFIRNGIRFDAFDAQGHPLRAAGVGNTGETRMSFEWTPAASKKVLVYPVCSISTPPGWDPGKPLEGAPNLSVSVNGVPIGGTGCVPGDAGPRDSYELAEQDVAWTRVRPGAKARVDLTVLDTDGRPVRDGKAVIGAGIYAGSNVPADPMPSQFPPTGPDDYVKDGIRYRAKIAGDTLVAAAIADQGRSEVTFQFTPATDRLGLRTFCLGAGSYQVSTSINGGPILGESCQNSATTDAGSYGGATPQAGLGLYGVRAGQVNTATVRLTDRNGKPVSMTTARIGVGIYQLGARRLVTTDGAGLELEEIKEYAGHLYRLDEVRTADATARSVQVATPAGVPFLVAFGSTDTGAAVTRGELSGLDAETPGMSGPNGLGLSQSAQPSRGPGTATLRITEGRPTKGKLVLATYTPLR